MHTASERMIIAVEVVKRLGTARAKDGTHPVVPPIANKVGFEGVYLDRGKYRSRIRYCAALNARDTRLNLGRWDSAADAGYAYAVAHVGLWGALSYFVSEVSAKELAAARYIVSNS